MYYVYILKIKNGPNLHYYIGYTEDLKRRIFEHKKDNEIELIYYEAYQSEKIARARERKLKQYGGAWRNLKRRLNLD
ncbi:MAG: GIY-YIG nuclease family protein [Patescibacteria group bacterium]